MFEGQTPARAHDEGPNARHVIPHQAVREELGRVLAGHEFRSSKRSQDFLRYVVENTLNGHADILKERTIGIEVFGRPSTYDPSEDATVRVKAGEVRKRLGLYYAGEGSHNPLRLDLPPGTYIPEFRRNNGAPEAALDAAALTPVPEPKPAAAPRVSRGWFAAGGMVLVAVAGFLLMRPAASANVIEQFWSPVLQGKAPVSICAAFVPVYWPDRPLDSKTPLHVTDFTLLTDQFVGGGDLIAVSRISALLTQRKRAYHVRLGNETSLHDLEAGPAIMVGYSYTRWKDISSELRYFIDGSRQPIAVTDNGTPTKWALPDLPPDRHTKEDYAIVSRVFHPDTHAMLVEIAGITQYGTDAASDLVTNPDLLAEALRGAPPDWTKKNLQIVLHVKVIGGAPTSPRIMAKHFW